MCLDVVKRGFSVVCGLIIGLDKRHLMGEYSQLLLVAIGRDPNNNYFPLAIAPVKVETKDS